MSEPEEELHEPGAAAGFLDDDLPPEAGGGDTGEPGGAEPQAPAPHPQTINFAQFINGLNAPQGVFGVGTASTAGLRSATGWLDAAEISAAVDRYVHPQPCFDQAADLLGRDRVVVLLAPSGHGKRSGAIALLRPRLAELVEDARCIMLSPDSTLEQLAKRKFSKGHGYVLLDRTDENATQPDFLWRQVRDRVRAHEAYLVVTTVHALRYQPESVQHIAWKAPEPEQVLGERLRGRGCDPSTIAEAQAAMPEECSLRDVVAAADLIVGGATPEEAWAEQSRHAALAVHEWFAKPPTQADYAAITTLAFAVGSNHRTFESLQARLEDLLPDQEPADTPAAADDEHDTASDPPRPVFGRRGDQLRTNPLITACDVPVDGINRSVLVFADPRHRQEVLNGLWAACDIRFWDAVRDWLTETITEDPAPALEIAIASGLAQLASTTFDEVVDSYLMPWAGGVAGDNGMAMAVQVLWCMCLVDDLAAAALVVARTWVESSNAHWRASAVTAIGGMLGVRFPTSAVRWLWHQIEHGGVVGVAAREQLAYLFAALIECDEDPGVVTELLAHRLTKQRAAPDALRRTTFATVLVLLGFRDWHTERPICAVAIVRRPALMTELAVLLAAVLVNRPNRQAAKLSLLDIISALPSLCDEPDEVTARFARALGAALPATERKLLADALWTTAIRRTTAHDELIGVFRDALLLPEDGTEHE